MDILSWVKGLEKAGNWVIGGDFNLISNLGEKNGGRQSLDKYREAFCKILSHSPIIDVETGNGWFSWNNK